MTWARLRRPRCPTLSRLPLLEQTCGVSATRRRPRSWSALRAREVKTSRAETRAQFPHPCCQRSSESPIANHCRKLVAGTRRLRIRSAHHATLQPIGEARDSPLWFDRQGRRPTQAITGQREVVPVEPLSGASRSRMEPLCRSIPTRPRPMQRTRRVADLLPASVSACPVVVTGPWCFMWVRSGACMSVACFEPPTASPAFQVVQSRQDCWD